MPVMTEHLSFNVLSGNRGSRTAHRILHGSMRSRLAILAGASILPMLLLFGAEGYAEYRAQRARAGQRQLEVARSMAATVERELAGAVAALQALALSPRLAEGDLDGFRRLAVRFEVSQPPGSALVLLDRSGQHLVNTLFPPGAPLPHRNVQVNEDLTRQVFETGRPAISNLFPRALNGALIVTADVPVLRDGRVAYDLSLVLPAQRFSAIIAGQHLAPGTVASVFDRNGINIARSPNPENMIGRAASPTLLPALMAEREGIADTVSREGVPLLTAFSHSQPSGWAVGIGVPETVLRAPLRHTLLVLLGAGLLGLGLSLGLAWLLAQRVLQPMRDLAKFAADPSHPYSKTGALRLLEVDAVAAALRHSLNERQAAMDALRALNGSLEARVRQEIASREEVQAQLAQAQRMEALGQLAGGIAHDFNNVLQAVTGGLSLIVRRADDAAAVRRLSTMAADAAGRGAAITGRLLTFARRGELMAVPIEPLALLESLREMLAHTLGAGITVVLDAPAAIPCLLADRAQLETVLVNLAVNARDAMPEGGTLQLQAIAEDGAPALDWPPDLPPGSYVRLSLTDTGIGMSPATLARASEPFFTTKAPGQGTGLGLAMARGFTEQSGGGFSIRSTPGSGTVITLWFPQASRSRAAERSECAPLFDASAPAMRILMVDDDSMVREVLARELEDRGFLVTTASDGLSALSLLDGGQPADVLVTDYAMPGMSGLVLIDEARQRRPDLPAVLLTGYAEADAALTMAQHRLTVLLRKPVSGEVLATRVAGLWRRESGGLSKVGVLP